jgi:hypothetical protein
VWKDPNSKAGKKRARSESIEQELSKD